MELEFDRDLIVDYETVAEVTLCQEETLESIVPDACPDILRIIDVCGQATLSGKQAKDGMAVVSGMVRAVILYQPESGVGLRRMEVGLPFTCQAEAVGLTERGAVIASARLSRAEARALNPRKVLLRVELSVDITACQPVEHTICCGVSNAEETAVCQRQYAGEHYQISTIQEKPFTFTDQIRLPGGAAEVPQVLSSRAQALCNESKLIGSKLIFKGTVELSCLLQEADGTLSTMHESMPFSQILEVADAGEDGDCQVMVEITDLRCEEVPGDGRDLEVEVDLLAQTCVRRHRPVTLLQDLYSTSCLMEAEEATLALCQLEDQSVRPQAVRELLEIPGMVRSVIDSRVSQGQITQKREGEDLTLAADLQLTILYLDENGLVQCVRKELPASCRLNSSPQTRCSCHCVCPDEVFASPSAGGIEVRFHVEFHCVMTRLTPVTMVSSAHLGAPRSSDGQRPSVVLRLPSPEESLWDIAKAYGTTTQQILQANELSDERLPAGRMLLIPSSR